VILGVAHSGAENPFTATRKDFESPLGVSLADHEFMDSLCGELSFDILEDEIAHRNEHSIEFQIVFLQQLLSGRHKIVPVLIGSFHEMLALGKRPEEDERIASFFEAMRSTLAQFGERVAVIVSVDLAHVGQRFGDAEPLSPQFLSRVEREDLDFLRAAELLDTDGVLESIARDNDARRVDGFPGIYTLLHVLPLREGRILKYSQTVDYQAQSAVSFASLAFA
jgi:hypothetical protein